MKESNIKPSTHSSGNMKLLIVVASSGSGVRAVGGLIKKRLSTHESMTRCAVGSIEINMTQLCSSENMDSGPSEVFVQGLSVLTAAAITELYTDNDKTFSHSSVVIVIVTTPIEIFLPLADLLKLVTSSITSSVSEESLGVDVDVSLAGVVAVAVPKGMLSDSIVGPSW